MNPCTRRTLLAATSATVVAGCLDETGGAADPSGGSDETSNASDDDPSGSDDAPDQPDQSGGPASCPEYDDRVERVVCYDDIDLEETDVYLEPDADAVAEGEELSFALDNGSEEALQTNFYDWRVDKYDDGEWHHVAPMAVNQPLMVLEPGERHAWTVTVDNDGLERGEPARSGGTEDVTLPAVGGGTYAFRARGWFESGSHEEAVAFAATFEFEGEPLELAPSEAVGEPRWDGESLVVESSRGDPDDEHHRLGAFELERTTTPTTVEGDGDGESEDGPRTVITEQLYRRPQLRDAVALALERDAERVRLEEYSPTIPVFGSRSDGVYEYRGEYYRVTTRELEE